MSICSSTHLVGMLTHQVFDNLLLRTLPKFKPADGLIYILINMKAYVVEDEYVDVVPKPADGLIYIFIFMMRIEYRIYIL